LSPADLSLRGIAPLVTCLASSGLPDDLEGRLPAGWISSIAAPALLEKFRALEYIA